MMDFSNRPTILQTSQRLLILFQVVCHSYVYRSQNIIVDRVECNNYSQRLTKQCLL